MNRVEIREPGRADLGEVAAVVARGMGENPHHRRDFGADPVRRLRRCDRFYRGVLPLIGDHGLILGAYRDGEIIGALGATGPGHCGVPLTTQVRLGARFLARLGIRATLGLVRWMEIRSHYDLSEPHWHLGPVAVDPGWQRQGVGSLLMAEFCRRIDRHPTVSPAFLETESSDNARFYGRFGFRTMRELDVLGVPSWIMRRVRPGEESTPAQDALLSAIPPG